MIEYIRIIQYYDTRVRNYYLHRKLSFTLYQNVNMNLEQQLEAMDLGLRRGTFHLLSLFGV
jgi:hypothetical protein